MGGAVVSAIGGTERRRIPACLYSGKNNFVWNVYSREYYFGYRVERNGGRQFLLRIHNELAEEFQQGDVGCYPVLGDVHYVPKSGSVQGAAEFFQGLFLVSMYFPDVCFFELAVVGEGLDSSNAER